MKWNLGRVHQSPLRLLMKGILILKLISIYVFFISRGIDSNNVSCIQSFNVSSGHFKNKQKPLRE